MALSAYSLISVDDLRSYGGWHGTGQDENFERACNAATRALERATSREFVTRGSVTLYFSIRESSHRLRLPQFPCKTVTSVHESTAWPRVYDGTTLLVEGTDYFYDASLGTLRRLCGGARTSWARGERAVQVVCVPGYSSPFGSATVGAYTPAQAQDQLGELIGLALVVAAGIYREGDAQHWNETQNTDAQGAVTRALSYLSPAQRDQLSAYARVEFGERTWEVVAA